MMSMLKIRHLVAALAVILIAAPVSLSATEPAAERAYSKSALWQEHWEPCLKDYPADRIVAMRGMDTMGEIIEEVRTAIKIFITESDEDAELAEDAVDYEQRIENIVGEMAAFQDSAKMKRMVDDIESVANHGCGVAQAMMGIYRFVGLGRRVDWFESLIWMMLAEDSGFEPTQDFMNNIISNSDAEDIATARAMADAWRPSD